MGVPVEGLGNYKGVMLCNRPMETGGGEAAKPGVQGDGLTPFRSTVSATHGETLGLGMAKADAPARPQRRPQGNPVLKRHMRWLKEMQEDLNAQRTAVVDHMEKQARNAQQVRDFCEKHREGVRQMMQEQKEQRAEEEQRQAEAARKAQLAAHRPAPGQRPAWSMTEKAAEEYDEEETDNLLYYVEGLDFDQYINDLEFRDAVKVVRDRAGKLKREQDAFKDQLARDLAADGEDGCEEGGDIVGDLPDAARRRVRAPVCDDDAASVAPSEASVVSHSSSKAKEVLAANPQMRAIHSKASVEKMIERQQGAEESQAA